MIDGEFQRPNGISVTADGVAVENLTVRNARINGLFWTSLALWDLARRDDLGRGAAIAWIAVILLLPFLGVIADHVVGRPRLPAWLRAAVVGGGLVAYLVVLGSGPCWAASPERASPAMLVLL